MENTEQQQPEEVETDGLLRHAVLVVQCAECASSLELAVNPDTDDVTDLYAECAACTKLQGLRCGVPIRLLVGAEVVQLENILAALEEPAPGVDSEPPFAQGGELEGGAGGA